MTGLMLGLENIWNEKDIAIRVDTFIQPLTKYKYGIYIKNVGLVTDQKKFHDYDAKDLLLQSPALFEKHKGGMCHDATLYVNGKLSELNVSHKLIYVASNKRPYLPTHSYVVYENPKDVWYALDVFSVKGCIYQNTFDTWEEAANFRKALWEKEEDLLKHKTMFVYVKQFPKPGTNIIDFMQYMYDNGIDVQLKK